MHRAQQLHHLRWLHGTGAVAAGHEGVTNQPGTPGSGRGMLAREEKQASRDQNETTLKRVIYGLIQGSSTRPRQGSLEGAADGRCLQGPAQPLAKSQLQQPEAHPPNGGSRSEAGPACSQATARPARGGCLPSYPGGKTEPVFSRSATRRAGTGCWSGDSPSSVRGGLLWGPTRD